MQFNECVKRTLALAGVVLGLAVTAEAQLRVNDPNLRGGHDALVAKQEAIIKEGRGLLVQWELATDAANKGNAFSGPKLELVKNLDVLEKEVAELKRLVNTPCVDWPTFTQGVIPNGTVCFVLGPVYKKLVESEKATLGEDDAVVIEAILPKYMPKQALKDAWFIVYGKKISNSAIESEKDLYAAYSDSQYESVAMSVDRQYFATASLLFFRDVIPLERYSRRFEELDKKVSDYSEALKLELRGKKLCVVCGTALNSDGTCPNVARHKGPEVYKCKECGTTLDNGVCPNAANHKPVKPEWQKFVETYGLAILAIVVVLVILLVVIALVVKTVGKKPKCMHCGAELFNGVCPNEACPGKPRCQFCGGLMHGGACVNPDCPGKKTPDDEPGGGPTKVPMPCKLVNFEDDATFTPAAFNLKVVSPAKWNGFVIRRLPKRFEVGRKSDKVPEGVPFLLLDMEGDPRARECSRRYIRMTSTDAGFSVDLLTDSGNVCKVGAKTLMNKGENAVAAVGETISLNPDWTFEVLKA